jgi:hypothetical protein
MSLISLWDVSHRGALWDVSHLVNRPDLAFTYSQLSKFVQSPGPVQLAAAEQALVYLRGTYNEGITYCDPGEERRNKLTD